MILIKHHAWASISVIYIDKDNDEENLGLIIVKVFNYKII